jgi:transcriptional regulator with XRE-family HTH domain
MPRPEDVTEAIARNLRGYRATRGWTLDALAARSGVSKGMLVQVEQGRTNPSISTLCRLADGLGVTLARLVEVEHEPAVRVVRAADVVPLFAGEPGSEGRLLVGSDPPRPLELWDWRLAPGDGYDGESHDDSTVELLHVLEGTLTLYVEGTPHRLAAGDAASFLADRPHRYANDDAEPLRFVMAVGMPDPPLPLPLSDSELPPSQGGHASG